MSDLISQHPTATGPLPGQPKSADSGSKRHCHPHVHHASVIALIFLLAITSIGLILLGIRNNVLLIIAGALQLPACAIMTLGLTKFNGQVYRGALIAYAACILIGLADIIRIAVVGPVPIERNPVSHSGFGAANVDGGGKQVDEATRGPWVASMVVNGAVLAVQAAIVFVLYRHYDVLVQKFVERRERTLERAARQRSSPYDVVVEAGER